MNMLTGLPESLPEVIHLNKFGRFSVKLSSQCSRFTLQTSVSSQAGENCKLLCYYFWNDVGHLVNLEIRLYQDCSKNSIIRAHNSNQVTSWFWNTRCFMKNKAQASRRHHHREHIHPFTSIIYGYDWWNKLRDNTWSCAPSLWTISWVLPLISFFRNFVLHLYTKEESWWDVWLEL